MSKPRIGLLLGGVLGLADGVFAYRYPDVRGMIVPIIAGSMFKGLVTGFAAGLVAKRTGSLALAIATGALLGLALGFLVAHTTPDPNGRHYYVEIMLPGMAVGVIAGFGAAIAKPRSNR
jgi:hypothetical protein